MSGLPPVSVWRRGFWRQTVYLMGIMAFGLGAAMAKAEAPRVLPAGKKPNDRRLGDPKNLSGYFPFKPPATQQEWQQRSERVRRQTKVATGLWPEPAKTPVNAVVHGRVDRPEYTVEKVYLESFPGFYVTGSLYRPKGRSGKLPGVLCPHGHWANGRFYDAGRQAARQQIVRGAERFENSGRFPLQARCMQLARMGCVVFHYDMIGYADSQQISFDVAHRYGKPRPEMEGAENWGFFSPQAELRLQHIMGLQTLDSVRALDWLLSLPEVDPSRIAVTGASGGGTQTFLLGAVDPRPAVAFPAVMVSTAMQGGCTCENCDYLRVDTGNIELAGLFAPKPLGMTGADDWTKEIATKGLPELVQLYKLLGAEGKVQAFPFVHFPHNYNYVSRAAMYGWFNKYLKLGMEEPVVEEDFQPLTVAEMSVWDEKHPKPAAGDDFERRFSKALAEASDKQLAELTPKDAASLARYREIVGGAVDVLIGHGLPPAGTVEFELTSKEDRGGYWEFAGLLRNAEHGQELPTVMLQAKPWNKQVVVWVDEAGKAGLYGTDGGLRPEIARLIAGGAAVAAVDMIYQGEFLAPGEGPARNRKVTNTDRQFAGFTYGYNHPLFAQRTHDILSLISFVQNHERKPERIDVIGLNGAGRLAAAACVQAGDAIDRAAIDTAGFRFSKLASFDDADFLPGAVKYGDLPGLLALAAPRALWLAGEQETPAVVKAAYGAAGKENAISSYRGAEEGEASAAVEWLLK
jgi:dienelactone hydrolase